MTWWLKLSPEEKEQMIEAACDKFAGGEITEQEFREQLANLGMNATDISDHVKENKGK